MTESHGTAPRRQSRVVPLCATFKVAKGVEKVPSSCKIKFPFQKLYFQVVTSIFEGDIANLINLVKFSAYFSPLQTLKQDF